jgi:hypothetical protein
MKIGTVPIGSRIEKRRTNDVMKRPMSKEKKDVRSDKTRKPLGAGSVNLSASG